jgi:Lipid A 3-O-deacylase (PagL)
MKTIARILAFSVFVLLATSFNYAQTGRSEPNFAVWSGANFANGHIVGFSQDRRMVQAAFTWTPALLRRSSFTLRYRIDAIPIALLHDFRYVRSGQPNSAPKEWVPGFGLSPAGVQLDFHNRTRLKPFVEVTGGFLYFRRKVLAYDETQFQFTVAPGVGARILLAGRTAVEFGYKYQHMSNANIDRTNPGLDSQIVYTGLCF